MKEGDKTEFGRNPRKGTGDNSDRQNIKRGIQKQLISRVEKRTQKMDQPIHCDRKVDDDSGKHKKKNETFRTDRVFQHPICRLVVLHR